MLTYRSCVSLPFFAKTVPTSGHIGTYRSVGPAGDRLGERLVEWHGRPTLRPATAATAPAAPADPASCGPERPARSDAGPGAGKRTRVVTSAVTFPATCTSYQWLIRRGVLRNSGGSKKSRHRSRTPTPGTLPTARPTFARPPQTLRGCVCDHTHNNNAAFVYTAFALCVPLPCQDSAFPRGAAGGP